MERTSPLRIAITGPESTGKSWLSKHLAEYFNDVWVPEYSREYLDKLEGSYRYKDILAIARGQFQRENQISGIAKNLVFCDTDFLVCYIWELVKYRKAHKWLDKKLAGEPYAFTLLCNIDLPWEYDPLRENPENRDYLFSLYHKELVLRKSKFAVIEGTGDERLHNAINALTTHGLTEYVNRL